MSATTKSLAWLGLATGALAVTALAVAQPAERSKDRKRSNMRQHKEMESKAPGMEEMMAVWMKYATPGKRHALLDPTVGVFDAKIKMWMDPSASEPEVSTGVMMSKWILGGRFIESHYKSTFMGAPFEGLNILGYDNYTKMYESSWRDTFGTMTYKTTGTVDPTGKVFTFHGVMQDPAQGGALIKTLDVTTVIDQDHYVFVSHHSMPDGSMMKIMEISYTRKNKS